MSELKHCPFCGGEAELRVYSAELQFVQCVNCLSSSNAFPTGREAIAAWNTRSSVLTRLRKKVKTWLLKKLSKSN